MKAETYHRNAQEATAAGAAFYFTGKPCKHGHVDLRLASSRLCRRCKYARDAKRKKDARWAEGFRIRKKYRDVNAKNRAAYARNRRDRIERVAKWRAENPEKARMNARSSMARRRARMLGSSEHFASADVARIFSDQMGRCAYCAEVLSVYHVDHITPIAKGGSNGPGNIAISCPECNQRKGVSSVSDFMRRTLRNRLRHESPGE